MSTLDSYTVIKPASPKTELEQFASWFHQDWKLVFSDFYDGARMYASSLSIARKAALLRELSEFVETHHNASSSALMASWLKLGAQGWERKYDIHKTLLDFVRILSGK